ncbi:MAG TPA: phenylalanine--tRNA ligase subunit beta [Patescibacteria group bacterium]
MDIKILDSHLREHLQTTAKPKEIAKALSLSSASIERVEPFGKNDFVYSIEVTTNRPDMVSVRGLAREAAAILPRFGFSAKLITLPVVKTKKASPSTFPISIKNDKTLVRRVLGIVLEVEKKESPQFIKDRLEAAGIRSLNNLIDITNYVMLEIGHPCHVFDFDRLTTKKLIIRPSKKGEKVVTLDNKEHILMGGDIVADNGKGEIVDLLGVMGTANSVVTDNTKKILFFFDNNDPWKIRKTSMGLAIRTDAAALNEKGVDPELALVALERGIKLYKELADAKLASDVLDIYEDKVKPTPITVDIEKISKVIGVTIPTKEAVDILTSLSFTVVKQEKTLKVTPPSWRVQDVSMEEDVIEEVARIYGYHNIPTELPPFTKAAFYHQTENPFYWEEKVKNAFKFWGFTEVYTYSMVSASILDMPLEQAVALKNPLDEEHVYMRKNLANSFETVLNENRGADNVQIFELANVYQKQAKELPKETQKLAFLLKGKINGEKANYFHAKGFLEQLATECNIKHIKFEEYLEGGVGAYVLIGHEQLGEILVKHNYVIAEINFEIWLQHANNKKVYKPLAKYPPVIEDLAIIADAKAKTAEIIRVIKEQNPIIADVSLLDQFEETRTFHIVYQHADKNLTTEEVSKIREQIITALSTKFGARLKE